CACVSGAPWRFCLPSYDQGRPPRNDTATRDVSAPPAGPTLSLTLSSYYDPANSHTSGYGTQPGPFGGTMYLYYIDSAKTKPYYFSYSYYDPGARQSYSAYGYNYSKPAETMSVTFPAQGPPLGFGSRHPSAMNYLRCDGSVGRFTYGAKGLGLLVGTNDGIPDTNN